jgi:hypothetical protein
MVLYLCKDVLSKLICIDFFDYVLWLLKEKGSPFGKPFFVYYFYIIILVTLFVLKFEV